MLGGPVGGATRAGVDVSHDMRHVATVVPAASVIVHSIIASGPWNSRTNEVIVISWSAFTGRWKSISRRRIQVMKPWDPSAARSQPAYFANPSMRWSVKYLA